MHKIGKVMILTILLALTIGTTSAQTYGGESIEDGTYDATVTTGSGTYTVPVEVEDGEVTHVQWPNGGNMHVYGADISNGEASGTNSRGDFISIEVDQ